MQLWNRTSFLLCPLRVATSTTGRGQGYANIPKEPQLLKNFLEILFGCGFPVSQHSLLKSFNDLSPVFFFVCMFVCFHLKIEVNLNLVKSQSHLNINLINDCLKNCVCWYNTHKIARYKCTERRRIVSLMIYKWAKGPWNRYVPWAWALCLQVTETHSDQLTLKMIRMHNNSHNLRAGSQRGPQERPHS